jgi:hypothetical protein
MLGKTALSNPNKIKILDSSDIPVTTPGASVEYFNTLDSLPSSNLTSGDQAFVQANQRFYVSNGNGWYNVAVVNTAPTLSISPSGTIVLSTEESATTITLTGQDSDNANLTFSVESDGNFLGIGTIVQDSSVFTITPFSSDSATQTTSTLTFKVTDGVNVASGTSALSLTFGATYSNKLNSTDYALGTTGGTFETSIKKQGTHGGTGHFHLFTTNDKLGGAYSFGTKGNNLTLSGNYWFATDNYNGSNYGGMHANLGTGVFVLDAWYHLVFSGSTTGPAIGVWITKEGQSFGNVLNRETFGGSITGSRVSALKIGGSDGLYLHGSAGNAADGGWVYYDDFRIYDAKASSTHAEAIFDTAGDVTDASNPLQSNLKLAYTFDNTANSI